MTRTRILLAALLAACMQPVELTAAERADGSAALAAWTAAGLPLPDVGRCDVRNFRVRVASASEFVQLCRTSVEAAYGCTRWDSSEGWFFYKRVPVVVIAPWWKSEPQIVIHELMHAYVDCSAMHAGSDPGDRNHTDPRVWSAAGGAESAQSRALAIVRQE